MTIPPFDLQQVILQELEVWPFPIAFGSTIDLEVDAIASGRPGNRAQIVFDPTYVETDIDGNQRAVKGTIVFKNQLRRANFAGNVLAEDIFRFFRRQITQRRGRCIFYNQAALIRAGLPIDLDGRATFARHLCTILEPKISAGLEQPLRFQFQRIRIESVPGVTIVDQNPAGGPGTGAIIV